MSASSPPAGPARPLAVSSDRCPLCGGPNHCQLSFTLPRPGSCWCLKVALPAELLARVPVEWRDKACLCRDCITHHVPTAATTAGLAMRLDDFYFEAGRMIFTEAYLRRRGYCCQNGCRHCPYPAVA